jgi:hypothetical protein
MGLLPMGEEITIVNFFNDCFLKGHWEPLKRLKTERKKILPV